MPILTPYVTRRHATTKGHIINLERDKPVDLGNDIYEELLAEGFGKAGGEVVPSEPVEVKQEEKSEELDPDKLNRIKEAMELILESGEDEKLTSDGEPRANEVNALVGEKTSKEEREAAWDMIRSA